MKLNETEYSMSCPKCQAGILSDFGHSRWRCDAGCGFACGLSFFFDDDNLSIQLEVGVPASQLAFSARARELMLSRALSLSELELFVSLGKLPAIKEAEEEEQDFAEMDQMMREVCGSGARVHRVLTNGESYRKRGGGGLIGKKPRS